MRTLSRMVEPSGQKGTSIGPRMRTGGVTANGFTTWRARCHLNRSEPTKYLSSSLNRDNLTAPIPNALEQFPELLSRKDHHDATTIT